MNSGMGTAMIALAAATLLPPAATVAEQATGHAGQSTREFEIRGDRPFLGGKQVELWGLRCGNALLQPDVTERHVNNLDMMAAHGINLIGVYIQGTNGGWPNPEAGLDGFRRDGRLKPEVAERLEWLIREADRRGMVVMVGLLSPRKDQDLYDEAAIKRAVEEAAPVPRRSQAQERLRGLVHEYNHPERIDHACSASPDGAAKKAKMTAWFKAVAPDIEVGVCPSEDTGTGDEYPGMDVRIIQKSMAIPSRGLRGQRRDSPGTTTTRTTASSARATSPR